MPAAALSPPRRPRRALWGLALVLGLPLLLAALVLDTGPRPGFVAPPDATAAGRTRDVAERLQSIIAARGVEGYVGVSEAEITAVLAAAQRLKPGTSGTARVTDTGVHLDVAAGPPLLPVGGVWLNLHLTFAPSEDGLRIASARIGRLPLPPALAMAGLRSAATRVLGPDLGPEALGLVAGLSVTPPRVTITFDSDPDRRAAFFEQLRDRALVAAGATAREQVYVQLWHLDKSVRQETLPRTGTLLPYLDRSVSVAGRIADGEDHEAMRAALYALALYCGDPDFGSQIGVNLRDDLQGSANGCEGTTLAGRDDLKRHFVVSAGLYAATHGGGAAFGMGELKELLDSNDGGSGFSFSDMAADLAGVRFAQAFLDAPRATWKPMLARLHSEADLMPPIDDMPQPMTDAEFRASYGDVDSPAYAAMVAAIQARVDALPLYAE